MSETEERGAVVAGGKEASGCEEGKWGVHGNLKGRVLQRGAVRRLWVEEIWGKGETTWGTGEIGANVG